MSSNKEYIKEIVELMIKIQKEYKEYVEEKRSPPKKLTKSRLIRNRMPL